jgi:hypothetical protein
MEFLAIHRLAHGTSAGSILSATVHEMRVVAAADDALRARFDVVLAMSGGHLSVHKAALGRSAGRSPPGNGRCSQDQHRYRDHGPTTTPVVISLAPITPGPPTVRPPSRRCGHLCRGPGVIAPAAVRGVALVALMPQWRQDYPNKRPPTRATAISEMGQLQTYAVQRTSARARSVVPLQPSL